MNDDCHDNNIAGAARGHRCRRWRRRACAGRGRRRRPRAAAGAPATRGQSGTPAPFVSFAKIAWQDLKSVASCGWCAGEGRIRAGGNIWGAWVKEVEPAALQRRFSSSLCVHLYKHGDEGEDEPLWHRMRQIDRNLETKYFLSRKDTEEDVLLMALFTGLGFAEASAPPA